MGFRFRKSIKIAPGLKLNLNKKSVSLTGGVKGAHYTINSSGRRTASVGIPGTGLSYVSSSRGDNSSGKNSSSNNKGSCLLTLLKIIGILIISPVLLLFGWIAGSIWLLFFRKRMSEDPDKQKKYTIGISIGTALSFLFFVYLMATAAPSPTALTLVSATEGQELDINSDYTINVLYEPADATLSIVKYNVDEASLAILTPDTNTPSVLTLHTEGEGTINITAETSSIESNTLTFEIIDQERIAEERAAKETEEKRLAEEKAAKEAEEKRLAEEMAAKEAEEKRLAEEMAAKEAEEKRLAEEKAAKEAEEKRLAEEMAAKEAEEKRLAEEMAAKEAEEKRLAEEEAAVVSPAEGSTATVPAAQTKNATMVWVDDTAKRYHKKNGCGMDNAYQVTLEEATAMGKTACGRCYK